MFEVASYTYIEGIGSVPEFTVSRISKLQIQILASCSGYSFLHGVYIRNWRREQPGNEATQMYNMNNLTSFLVQLDFNLGTRLHNSELPVMWMATANIYWISIVLMPFDLLQSISFGNRLIRINCCFTSFSFFHVVPKYVSKFHSIQFNAEVAIYDKISAPVWRKWVRTWVRMIHKCVRRWKFYWKTRVFAF